jgi:hypothetical protein
MAYPTAYTSTVAIPLPSEQAVQQIMGKSYDPERTLNVLKMFAGTDPDRALAYLETRCSNGGRIVEFTIEIDY